MSLFINREKYPYVYRSETDIIAPNQDVFKQEPMSDMLETQQRANASLQRSLENLEESYAKQARIQSRRMTSVQVKLNRLNERHIEQKELENDVESLFKKYSGQNEALASKIEQHLYTQISKQEEFELEVIERLDKQEAITEKLMRKMDDFRSILYERTSFITDKIEKGYHSTSAYLHKMIPERKPVSISKEKQENLE